MDVKRYYWNQTTIGDGPFDGPGYMSSSSDDPSYDRQVVDASDFDRLTAELAALQSRLNETGAENDRLRAQVANQDALSFDFRHPFTAQHEVVTMSKADVYEGMSDSFYEKLSEQICKCDPNPVGETNVTECDCDEYAHDFEPCPSGRFS